MHVLSSWEFHTLISPLAWLISPQSQLACSSRPVCRMLPSCVALAALQLHSHACHTTLCIWLALELPCRVPASLRAPLTQKLYAYSQPRLSHTLACVSRCACSVLRPAASGSTLGTFFRLALSLAPHTLPPRLLCCLHGDTVARVRGSCAHSLVSTKS